MFKITIFLHPVYLLPFITIFTAITAFPVSASETKVTISKKDCGQLIHHQFYRDIDFEPGVDVRGKKVKSVEYFGAEKLTLQKELSFTLNLDFGKIMGTQESWRDYVFTLKVRGVLKVSLEET